MKVSGFSIVRNGVIYDYPFLESIRSILPLCDEFIVAVGNSNDDTLRRIQALESPKIRIIQTVWDDTLRTGGAVLAQQTNIALDQVTGDWAFYLQADEVIHEKDLDTIREGMLRSLADLRIEGLLFPYRHFYGSYQYLGSSRRWYRNEVRVFRTGIGVRSWGDAQGFRIGTRKLNVVPLDTPVYHYGWVRPPGTQQLRQRNFHRMWHPDEWVTEHVGSSEEFDYSRSGPLALFTGTHPAVMVERVQRQDWDFTYDPSLAKGPLKDRVLDWIERHTGWRIGEYRNYRIL